MRKSLSALLLFCLTVICCSNAQSVPGSDKKPVPEEQDDQKELRILLSLKTSVIDAGGYYGRVHRLNDGRLMAAYSSGASGRYCFSSDDGESWTSPGTAIGKFTAESEAGSCEVRIDNAEFAQLSNTNPYHPGRVIYACNLRPADSRVHPFSIAVSSSDDGARTWSPLETVYGAAVWNTNVGKGSWEPFVIELPDGSVRIFFADETPYYLKGLSSQNISYVESHDGGDSWSEARVACYNEGRRDGMPSVLLLDDWMYLAIEHADRGESFHPQLVSVPVSDAFSTTVFGDSDSRFEPLSDPAPYDLYYRGAPYLISTDNYVVLSWQSSEGSSVKDFDHAMMEIAAMPKSEITDHRFSGMRAQVRPDFGVAQASGNVLWNSLCDLGSDHFLAVATVSGCGLVCLRCKVEGK